MKSTLALFAVVFSPIALSASGVIDSSGFSPFEIVDTILKSFVVIFLVRNENRLTVLETTLKILSRGLVKVRETDFKDEE